MGDDGSDGHGGMPFSEPRGHTAPHGRFTEIFRLADLAGDEAIKESIVESGEEGRREIVGCQEGVRSAFACVLVSDMPGRRMDTNGHDQSEDEFHFRRLSTR
jgi:hypothetical protein